jgi:hypothetical protein
VKSGVGGGAGWQEVRESKRGELRRRENGFGKEGSRLGEASRRTRVEVLRGTASVRREGGAGEKWKRTETVVNPTLPSAKTVTNASSIPPVSSFRPAIGVVRQYSVVSGTCRGRDAGRETSRVAQSEKNDGSSIIEPQMRKRPSRVRVKRTGPELREKVWDRVGKRGRGKNELGDVIARSPADAPDLDRVRRSRTKLEAVWRTSRRRRRGR